MVAKPIVPGRAYRVHFGKTIVDVIASNPCEALIIIAKAKDQYTTQEFKEKKTHGQ